VIAAERATQYALIWSSFVISFQTVLISLQPNTASQRERETAPRSIIQKGTHTFQIASHPDFTASLIAASGQIALATSLAQ